MLCGISDNREKDQTDECLGDVGGLDERVDAVDKILGADCYGYGYDDENTSCGPRAHLWFLLVHTVSLGLGIEEDGVSAELEEQVEDVEDKEDNGSAVGEDEDVAIGVLGRVCED